MKYFCEPPAIPHCLCRFSPDNLKPDDDVLNIPLFMEDRPDRLIGLALEQRNMKVSTPVF